MHHLLAAKASYKKDAFLSVGIFVGIFYVIDDFS
jgi:hypothetical protein